MEGFLEKLTVLYNHGLWSWTVGFKSQPTIYVLGHLGLVIEPLCASVFSSVKWRQQQYLSHRVAVSQLNE